MGQRGKFPDNSEGIQVKHVVLLLGIRLQLPLLVIEIESDLDLCHWKFLLICPLGRHGIIGGGFCDNPFLYATSSNLAVN